MRDDTTINIVSDITLNVDDVLCVLQSLVMMLPSHVIILGTYTLNPAVMLLRELPGINVANIIQKIIVLWEH